MMDISFELYVLLALLGHNCGLIKGEVTVSPSGTALACDGDQLELTCSLTGRVLEWNINLLLEDDSFEYVLDSVSQISPSHTITVNSIMFTFSRVSSPNSQPLTSRLVISQVNSSIINGTVVNCADRETRDSSSTVINVITGQTIVDSPEFNLEGRINFTIVSEEFDSDGVTATLEWTQGNSLYSYQVSVVPPSWSSIIISSERVRLLLKEFYDVLYNVSVETSLCGLSGATASTTLYYASSNCENPEAQLDDSVEVIGYLSKAAAVKGSNISFSCPPGLVLTGPNSSTCLGNGEWEPDPRDVKCKVSCGQPPSPPRNAHVIPYFSTLEGATVSYVCWTVYQEENTSLCIEINTTAVCNNNGNWEPDSQDMCFVFLVPGSRSPEGLSRDRKIAVASSVMVFTVASILFFIIGFLCGHCCQKNRKTAGTVPPSGGQTQIPYYEDVVLQQHEQETQLELKQNVAYVPVR